jgi:hypothetical protein
MTFIQELAGRVATRPAIGTAQLAMVPLVRATPSPLRYRMLGAALADGTCRITEVSEHGSVPDVRVLNKGDLPLLLVDGAALVGAKQNRILNLTILVAAASELVVPVSCVERGRWHARGSEFSEGASMHFAAARAQKLADVSESLRVSEGQRPRADQGRVWATMGGYAARLAADAPTGAMQDVYRAAESRVEAVLKPLRPVEGQVGAVFLQGSALLGLDLFDSPGAFAAEFPKLARSYAVDAVEPPVAAVPAAGAEGGEALARTLLADLAAAAWQTYPAVGLGTDLRLATAALVAGALAHEGEVVHLVAFPARRRAAEPVTAASPPMPRRPH